MARATDVCDLIDAELSKRPPGRPREWTTSGILAALVLLARHRHAFFINWASDLIATASIADRERLGLNGADGEPLTTRQISYGWNEIARCIDPGQSGLDHSEKIRRLDLLNRVNNELLWSTIPREVRRQWQGDVSVDATTIWGHGKPPRGRNEKQYATGKDGDGPPTYVSKIDPFEFDEVEDNRHPILDGIEGNADAPEAFHSHGRRRRKDRGRRSVGARWIGHKSFRKVVYGYAHHAAVMTGPEGGGPDNLPLVAVGQITTPVTANPAYTARTLVEELHGRRSGDEDRASDTKPIGDVLADGGYSQAKPEHWHLPLRALGAEPIFRLHSQNQEGHRGSTRDGQLLHIDGRYYCSCLPEHLRSAEYPHRPTHDSRRNTRRMATYRSLIAARKPFELREKGNYRDKGMRFLSPHHDGCPRCDTSDQRCCQIKYPTLTWDELGTYQRHQFGTEEWADSYNRRNRVEGYFGVLKNESIANHSRGTARFFEYAKVALTFTFNAMATNLHQLHLWFAKQAELAAWTGKITTPRGRRPKHHSLAAIAENPELLGEIRKAKRRAPAKEPPKKRGTPKPNPFAHLANAPH